MPNWCECHLIITSNNNSNLEKFFNENKSDDMIPLSFNINVPIPEDQEENWYNWNCENWGTKWDLDDETDYTLNDDLTYMFNTAWCPPTRWLLTVSKLYPYLEFNLIYGELGMDFGGDIKISDGECVEIEEFNYSQFNWKFNKEYIIDLLAYSIDSNLIDSNSKVEENIKNKINLQKSIIEKICYNYPIFLPIEIHDIILTHFKKNIKLREIYNYLDKNVDLIKELCNEEIRIYDDELIQTEIISELKRHYISSRG